MFSLVHPETTVHADQRARREAMILAGLAQTHWPQALVEDESVISLILESAVPFAASARRVMDHTKQDLQIEETSYGIAEVGDVLAEQRKLRYAVNGIIHAVSLHVVFTFVPEKLAQFVGIGAYAPVFLRYETDLRGPERVSIYGMAFAYLRSPKLIRNIAEA